MAVRREREKRRGRRWSRSLVGVLAGGLLACSAGGSAENELPPTVQDPSRFRTPGGAVALYRQVVPRLPRAFDMLIGGILTDELAGQPATIGLDGPYTGLDSRQNLSAANVIGIYNNAHKLRSEARETRGLLRTYAPDSMVFVGHLYAVEGYAELFLAELFCSGIPLSTVDFEGDYTLAGGSTTAEVFAHASALFDTASTMLGGNPDLQSFAAVGRGRALLSLDSVAAAAAAVASVPSDYQSLLVRDLGQDPLWGLAEAYKRGTSPLDPNALAGTPEVGDREGVNGLDFRSSGDPRTAVYVHATHATWGDLYFPVKYDATVTTYTLASGVEARLIEAEAALRAGGDWLGMLNTLRTDGTFDTQPNGADPSTTDTLWHAGTGAMAGLRPLEDPGSADARVDLLFRERAFWLYLTGHRQGDLRRLIRQYGRQPNAVYPTGGYAGGNGRYGTEMVVPVPASERQYNPKYTGCFHRNA